MNRRDAFTEILRDATRGDEAAANRLIELVYSDLHRQAMALMSNERSWHTLQPTVLVHEAFIQLIRHDRLDWQGRGQFFALAATVMRRILVDHARARDAQCRGSGRRPLSLDEGMDVCIDNDTDIIELHNALERLEKLDERAARLVVLRFFGGLTMSEAAAVLGVSTRTAEADWSMARVWLLRSLTERAP